MNLLALGGWGVKITVQELKSRSELVILRSSRTI